MNDYVADCFVVDYLDPSYDPDFPDDDDGYPDEDDYPN